MATGFSLTSTYIPKCTGSFVTWKNKWKISELKSWDEWRYRLEYGPTSPVIIRYPKFSKKRCRITQHNLGEVIAQTEIVIIRMMCGFSVYIMQFYHQKQTEEQHIWERISSTIKTIDNKLIPILPLWYNFIGPNSIKINWMWECGVVHESLVNETKFINIWFRMQKNVCICNISLFNVSTDNNGYIDCSINTLSLLF